VLAILIYWLLTECNIGGKGLVKLIMTFIEYHPALLIVELCLLVGLALLLFITCKALLEPSHYKTGDGLNAWGFDHLIPCMWSYMSCGFQAAYKMRTTWERG